MLEKSVRLLNVLSKSEGLLSPDLELQRLSAPISYLSVKGDPRKSPGGPGYKETRGELGELEAVRRSMLNSHDIHAECGGEGNLALVRKMSPHGMNEMSVFAQDGYHGVPIDNLFGFGSDVRKSFYRAGIAFCEYAENNNLYPVVSYTYDPHTYDRKSPQSVKIFHLQLTARSTEELAEMQKNKRPLSDVPDVVEKRQLVDESSVVVSLAICDYLSVYPLKSLVPIAPFSQDGCSNVRFSVGQSWESILTPEFDDDLHKIHDIVTEFYQDFANFALNGDIGHWRRPNLSSTNANSFFDGLSWMQNDTKKAFKHYISGLNNRHLQNTDLLVKHKFSSHIYPAAGICLSTTFTRGDNGDVMLSIRPQIFAEAGATGLQYLDAVGAQVRIKRGEGQYSEDELKQKRKFEKECSQYIVKSLGK